jgi:predicted RNase H-like HicB family nuclease
MKNYTVYIEQDEDGVYVGSVPTVPGCYTQGATLDELINSLKEVLVLCLRNMDSSEHSRFVGVQNIEIPA